MDAKEVFVKPGNITEYTFSFILLVVLIVSLSSFSIQNISQDTQASFFKVGLPFPFFEISANPDEGKIPINIGYLILDFLLYFFVAYLIELIFHIVKITAFPSRKEETKTTTVQNSVTQNKIVETTTTVVKEDKMESGKKIYLQLMEKGHTKEEIKKMFLQKGWPEQEIIKLETIVLIEKRSSSSPSNQSNIIAQNYEAAKQVYKSLRQKNYSEEQIGKMFADKGWSAEQIKKLRDSI
jgi:hypothetical protein